MSTTEPSIAFIICSEKGQLEKKSVLFAKSLRKFGGALKESPIYSICPREGFSVSESTIKSFEKLNVHHRDININTKYRDYNFANKIEACAYFERELEEEKLVFCDSDQLVLGDLSELILRNEEIATQQVAFKGIGTNGNDENTEYWEELYKLLNVQGRNYMLLRDSGEKIYPYYNAGLISVKRNLGLFKSWKKNFDLISDKGLLPKHGSFFQEQSVLSATVASMQLNMRTLPMGYNFHLFNTKNWAATCSGIRNKEIKLLHYHKTFDEPNSLNVSGVMDNQLKWINSEIIETELNTKPFLFEKEKEKEKEDVKNSSSIKQC